MEATCMVCNNRFDSSISGWQDFCSDECEANYFADYAEDEVECHHCKQLYGSAGCTGEPEYCPQCNKLLMDGFSYHNEFCSEECWLEYEKAQNEIWDDVPGSRKNWK